ncbi:MAG: GAF domain-containing protein [Proteobacteria bacterium]|nr:GAF domain-containing protein [Pseudomonadota bacterium]
MASTPCLLLTTNDLDFSATADLLGAAGLEVTTLPLSEFNVGADSSVGTSTDMVLLRAADLARMDEVPSSVFDTIGMPRVLVFETTDQIDASLLHQWPFDDYVALDWDAKALRARIDWIFARNSYDAGSMSSHEALSPDAVVRVDKDLMIVSVNRVAEDMFAGSSEDLCGKAVSELFTQDTQSDLQSVLKVSLGAQEAYAGRTGELLALRSDGSKLPVEVYVRSRQSETGSVLLMFVRDISSQEHYRGAYFRHERHMRALGRLTEDLLHSERVLDYGGVLQILVPTISAIRGRFYLTAFDRNTDAWQRECVAEWWVEQDPAVSISTSNLSAAALERDEVMLRWFAVLQEGEVVATPAECLPTHEAEILNEQGIKSLLVVPLKLRNKLLGFIRFDSQRDYPGWDAGDVRFLRSAARSICHAHATLEERRYRMETQEVLYHERVWLETIRQASELITSTESLESRLTDIAMFLLNVIPVDQFIVSTREQGRVKVNGVYTSGRQLKAFQYWTEEDSVCPGHGRDGEADKICNRDGVGVEIIESGKHMHSCVCVPLMHGDAQLGTMALASEEKNVFDEHNRPHLESLATQLAHVVTHIQRYEAARSEAEHLAVIVREVHHRIKNNLQGVIGLLNRHRNSSPEVDRVIGIAIAQLNAVAEAHNQLSRRPSETVYLGDLVSGVCKAVRPLTAHSLSIDEPSMGNRLVVPAAEVVPVALVLNELIQNVLDHGFESDEGGSIRVAVNESGDSAVLTIANNGKPPPESLDSSTGGGFGTGLTLVRSLLPSNGSRFSLTHDDGWTIAEVCYDIPAIMQREP